MDEVLARAGMFQGVDSDDAEALARQFETWKLILAVTAYLLKINEANDAEIRELKDRLGLAE